MELEDARMSLLEQIQDHELHQSIAEDALDQIKGQYNLVIEKQITQQRGILSDPLDIFPPEIWIQLIQYSIASSDGKSVDFLLILTLISTKWRYALLICSEFWSEIAIGPGLAQPDSMAVVKTCLFLSREYPLSLVIEHPTRDWDIVAAVMRPHAHRISAITIRRLSTKEEKTMDVENPSVTQILLSFGHLPRLSQLHLHRSGILDMQQVPIFLSQTSSLMEIDGDWITSFVLPHEALKSVRRIPASAEMDVLIPWIQKHQSVKILWYKSIYQDELDEKKDVYISHTQLESLTIRSRANMRLIKLISASRSLTKLVIEVSWKLVAHLFQILDVLTVLDKLTLNFTEHRSQSEGFDPQPIFFNTGIRNLNIDHGYWYHLGTEHAQLPYARLLYQIFRSCATAVEKLTISARGHFEMPWDYLISLSSLHSLRLTLLMLDELQAPEMELPSVNFLRLKMRPDPTRELFSSIKCHNLSELQIDGVDAVVNGDTEDSPQPAVELDPSSYRNLFSLRWGSEVLRWNTTSLKSLTSVNFRDKSNVTASDFCVYLAKRPYDCPALEQIDFRSWPEWDCLYIMLERRNFLKDSSVSHIKTVTFPSTVAPSVRHAIADLLRGRFTRRPSNRDVSLIGIGEIFWDPSISGCYQCCMSLQPCTSPIFTGYTPKREERQCSNYVEALSPDPPLPPELADWLATRQDRYHAWYLLEQSWNHDCERDIMCTKHELGWKYVTTGFTFCDIGADYSESLNPYSSIMQWSKHQAW